MRILALSTVLVFVLAGCGSDGSVVASSSAGATPEAELCGHLRDLRSLMQDLLKGTVTHDEAVGRLTDLQTAFEADTQILRDQGASKATVVDAIAVGVGRLKVAMDNAGTEFMASPEVTAALTDLAEPLRDVLAC